jgi:hypothetical protein
MRARTPVFAALLALTAGCGRDHKSANGPAPAAPPTGDAVPNPDAPPAQPAPLAAATDQPVNEGAANFRGFFATQDVIKERLIDPVKGEHFYLGRYLDSYPDDFPFEPGLPALLGVYSGDGVRSEFRNGQANALNMVLWNLTFQSLARDAAAAACPSTPGTPSPSESDSFAFSFSDGFLDVLAPLCGGDQAPDAAALGAVWDAVMASDAPQEERDAFLADFGPGGDAFGVLAAKGQTAVTGTMTAILMNPHFLIRQ